jgi:peptide/nickel transport system substrate-binding protein
MFLLLAAGAARAEDPSGDKGLSTYAIAMHGQPALPADFSRLPYADPQATKGGHLALAYQGTFDSLNPYNLSAGSTAQGLIGNVFQSLMLRSLDEPFTLYGEQWIVV